MNYTDYRISLDIFKTASQAVLPVKQGDTAYRLCISITANGSPYRITEGCYALFTAKKPDENFINNECTIENNVIYYQLTPQTTAAIGVVECEIVLYDSNDEQLATPHFNILVDAKAYNGEDIESTDEANMLDRLIKDSITQINEVEEKLANGEFNGKDGKDGEDGVDGKDGKDGVDGKDGKDADYNLVCNALKGSASGNPIRIDDVSPLEHEIAVRLTPNGIIEVKGANLIPKRSTATTSGVTATVSDDGTITFSGTTTKAYNYYLYNGKIPAGSYYLSWNSSIVGGFRYVYNATARKVILEGDGKITLETESDIAIYITQPNIDRAVSGSIRPMFNEGSTALPYEPYIEPTTYAADENGNVNVTSVYPTTTLIADNGVIISVEYNRDINKAFAELMQAVAAAKEV